MLLRAAFAALAPLAPFTIVFAGASTPAALPVAPVAPVAAAACADEKADLDTLRDVTRQSGPRKIAARQLAKALGPGIADEFIELGPRSTTTPDLRVLLATLLADMRDPAVDKKTVALLRDANATEKLFYLHASKNTTDPKLVKEICERCIAFTAEREDDVRAVAVETLVQREYVDAIPALERMLKRETDSTAIGIAVAGLTKLHRRAITSLPAWEARLTELTTHDSPWIRNAALAEIAAIGKAESIEVVARQLESKDWSTRVAALLALEKLRNRRVIPLIIARMPHEADRTLEDFAATLERLTGAPLGADAARWQEWWSHNAATFELSGTAARPSTKDPGRRRDRDKTAVQFLGIPVNSRRIVFVVDISGSMLEMARGVLKHETDSGGESTTRIEVVKRELSACIDKLEPDALFNVIVFSDTVSAWLESGMVKMGKKTREDGKAFVMSREAKGGTNLYDALKRAFQDLECDTIYILSDGQPTAGEETDAATIRAHVALWNATRHIRIHTIAVGERLALLKSLSTDAGGEHVEYK